LHSFAPLLIFAFESAAAVCGSNRSEKRLYKQKRRTRRKWVQLKMPDIRTAVNS